MFVIKQKCNKNYKDTMSINEFEQRLKVSIVLIQVVFFSSESLIFAKDN